MKIGIIGGGVVGSATAKCYAATGHEVRVYDRLKSLSTHDLITTLESELVFVCLPENCVDPFFDYNVPENRRHANYVLKSTVPIGTTRRLAKKYGLPNLVHSPEFLTERTAEYDAAHPRVNIVGDAYFWTGPSGCCGALSKLYVNTFPDVPLLCMSSNESEAVKLFTNTFFAVKVAAFNEFRCLADKLGLDWDTVVGGMLADGRIHPMHTQVPGPDGKRGFGGRCLPNDLDTFIDQYNRTPNTGWASMAMAAKARNSTDRLEVM